MAPEHIVILLIIIFIKVQYPMYIEVRVQFITAVSNQMPIILCLK